MRGLGKRVENELANCVSCRATTTSKSASVIRSSPLPLHLWQIVNLDYLGPLLNSKYVLVLIDLLSKYSVVVFSHLTSTSSLISVSTQIFNQFLRKVHNSKQLKLEFICHNMHTLSPHHQWRS